MTVLLAIIIASILCGVLFSAMWASSNSLCIHPEDIGVKVILQPKGDADGIEHAVNCVQRQLEQLNTEPELYIITAELSSTGLKTAQLAAEDFGATLAVHITDIPDGRKKQ